MARFGLSSRALAVLLAVIWRERSMRRARGSKMMSRCRRDRGSILEGVHDSEPSTVAYGRNQQCTRFSFQRTKPRTRGQVYEGAPQLSTTTTWRVSAPPPISSKYPATISTDPADSYTPATATNDSGKLSAIPRQSPVVSPWHHSSTSGVMNRYLTRRA